MDPFKRKRAFAIQHIGDTRAATDKLVLFNVEHDVVTPQKTGIAIRILDISRRCPRGAFDIVLPHLQHLMSSRRALPKNAERFVHMDSHGTIISCSHIRNKRGYHARFG